MSESRFPDGHTVIELCVVLSLFALLASVTWLPSLVEREVLAVHHSANTLQTHLRALWMAAVISKQPAEVRIEKNGYRLFLGSTLITTGDPGRSLNLSGPPRIWLTSSGIVKPATIALRGKYIRCNIICSLRGRFRKHCENTQ